MDLDERIRRDAELLAGDPEAAALLECLGRHAFDPAHDVGSMVKACGASRRVKDRLAEWRLRLRRRHPCLDEEEARRSRGAPDSAFSRGVDISSSCGQGWVSFGVRLKT